MGNRAREFCHGERCGRWSPGEGKRRGRQLGRRALEGLEKMDLGVWGSHPGQKRVLSNSRDEVQTLGKGKTAPPRWDFEPSVMLPASLV